MLKPVAAYCTAAIAGAAVFVVFHHTSYAASSLIADISASAILNGGLILPFWIATILIANAMKATSVVFYILSALIIGMVLLPLLVAAGPQMAFDSSPDLDYIGRVTRNFRVNGLAFFIMSMISGLIYWFIAVESGKRSFR